MRRFLLKVIAVVGYLPDLGLAWLFDGPNWLAKHNKRFWLLWGGER